ncbi:MAG: nicotinate-nicotinamide nucleotide adenylyltransferase [Candidatus Saccharimonadales bacterium]
MTDTKNLVRIGIYAGTFNPVHSGHVAFALQAVEAAELDMIYFMPERRPRAKDDVEHFGHRMAMLRQAIMPHEKLGLLDLVDVNFSVQRTMPRLRQEFPDSQLVFLMGSDVAPGLPDWPHAKQLLANSELVVGVRTGDDSHAVKTMIDGWPLPVRAVTIFDSYAPAVSSRIIRQALRQQTATRGLLPSVQRYSNHHWLYVSVA